MKFKRGEGHGIEEEGHLGKGTNDFVSRQGQPSSLKFWGEVRRNIIGERNRLSPWIPLGGSHQSFNTCFLRWENEAA